MNGCVLAIILILFLAFIDFVVTKVFGGSESDTILVMIVISVIFVIYAIIATTSPRTSTHCSMK